MARRLPSAPPPLPGFTPVRVLGAGGFADVFLFEQNMPRRQVAVKVMLPEVVNDQVRRMFQVEADLMATLSAHPSILTVYEAGVSSDGRPYLVMELCSSSLGQSYRRQPLPVAEVLRIGVKIGGALHTAHQQGILHRDVKPSNILLTAYGAPVLSDFGISSTTRGSAAAQAVGLSIPWSAPEVVAEETQGTVASEVWALAATLYSLLAGRSPFEEPGTKSAPGDLARRIVKSRLPPIGRDDVPASLERVLAGALSKKPRERPASALELLRELQAVETELGLGQTSADIAMAEWASGYARDDDERTVLYSGHSGHSGHSGRSGAASTAAGSAGSGAAVTRRARRARRPGGSGAASGPGHSDGSASGHPGRSTGSGAFSRTALESSDRTRVNGARAAVGTTSRAAAAGGRRGVGGPQSGRRRTIVVTAVVAGAALLAGAGITLFALGQSDGSIPRVGEITAVTTGGRILFSWDDPGLEQGDGYLVSTEGGADSMQRGREFAAFPTGGSSVCITVAVVRSGTTGEASSEKCAALG
ncbi:serine/threonine-protein kinase [Herbiconiux sp.]|uniref:serine/threonine-protein kinase n=1 Tax=Herbiconiux sp. TaxID=1871186 RepID=UPI0025B94385|nr:serine/threonine-protein kinase [Herbiconiux sp.]